MDLEKQAIEILQTFSGDEPYQLGYSGGKDSDVILHLAKKAGVQFRAGVAGLGASAVRWQEKNGIKSSRSTPNTKKPISEPLTG